MDKDIRNEFYTNVLLGFLEKVSSSASQGKRRADSNRAFCRDCKNLRCLSMRNRKIPGTIMHMY
jgi:hypothetical protein